MEKERSVSKPAKGSSLRLHLSAANLIKLLFALLIGSFVAFWVYFHVALERTIVVDATTGALEIELDTELSGKTFRDVWICKKVIGNEESAAVPPERVGCPSISHHFVERLEFETLTLPAGTVLRITSLPDLVRIDIRAVPERYADSEVGLMVGGAYILSDRTALRAFGTLSMTGKLQVGARFSETDRVSIVSGSYQIRGYTPIGLLGGELRELRSGKLQSGARVRFVQRDGKIATGHIAVMLPDLSSSLLQVTAISPHDTNNLAVKYYFTKEVIFGASFFDALILDPLIQLLLAFFGAIAGYGWLRRLTTK